MRVLLPRVHAGPAEAHHLPGLLVRAASDFDMALAEVAWTKGYELGLERGTEEAVDGDERFSKLAELLPLRDVISLCHPDRHPAERSELANRVTQSLLELRQCLAPEGARA